MKPPHKPHHFQMLIFKALMQQCMVSMGFPHCLMRGLILTAFFIPEFYCQILFQAPLSMLRVRDQLVHGHEWPGHVPPGLYL